MGQASATETRHVDLGKSSGFSPSFLMKATIVTDMSSLVEIAAIARCKCRQASSRRLEACQ
jgi:hypothetical protein